MENPVNKYPYIYFKRLNYKQNYQLLPLFLLVLVVIAGILYDSYFLFRYPIAVGIDGYYYVVQVDSLFQQGHFNYPVKAPLILFLMYGAKIALGDTIFAIKIVVISLQSLLSLGSFLTISKITKNNWIGLVSSTTTCFASLHFYYTSEFLNNLGAIVFIIWGFLFLCQWKINKRHYINQILSIICLGGAFLSHKSAVYIIISFLLLGLISSLLLQSNTGRKYKILIVFGFILATVSPYILVLQQIVELPRDLLSEINYTPHIPIGIIAIPEKIILLIISPLIVFIIYRLPSCKKNNFGVHFFLTVNLWTLLITLNPFLYHQNNIIGIVVRLDSLSYIQLSLLLSGFIWLISENHPEKLLYIFLLLPFLLWGIFAKLPYGLRREFLNTQLQLSRNLPYYKHVVEPDSIIIAAHGDQFLITSRLLIRSQQNFEDSLLNRKIYWLISGLESNKLRSSFSLAVDEKGLNTILLSHNELISLLNSTNDMDKQRLLWKNLHLRNSCISHNETEKLIQCNY